MISMTGSPFCLAQSFAERPGRSAERAGARTRRKRWSGGERCCIAPQALSSGTKSRGLCTALQNLLAAQQNWTTERHGRGSAESRMSVCPIETEFSQHLRHSPRAEERPGGEQLVDPPHQREIVVIGRRGRSVDARARNAEQCAGGRSSHLRMRDAGAVKAILARIRM